jgi:predicted RNA-binding protein YlqC (UPF0109 family)
MPRGEITERVVRYLVTEIVDNPDDATLEMVEEGGDRVTVEVHTAKSDMGRVIGRRGRVARAIRTLAQAAADEEGLEAGVEFID